MVLISDEPYYKIGLANFSAVMEEHLDYNTLTYVIEGEAKWGVRHLCIANRKKHYIKQVLRLYLLIGKKSFGELILGHKNHFPFVFVVPSSFISKNMWSQKAHKIRVYVKIDHFFHYGCSRNRKNYKNSPH